MTWESDLSDREIPLRDSKGGIRKEREPNPMFPADLSIHDLHDLDHVNNDLGHAMGI